MNDLINLEQEPEKFSSNPVDMLSDGLDGASKTWELKELKPMHKQVASLVAQGLKNVEIAKIVNITPQYVTMLLRQPLVRAYIAEMCEVTGARMEALFVQSTEVIADAMANGNRSERLKAARLQLEATKRIGRPDPSANLGAEAADRLETIANRLLSLQSRVRQRVVIDNETGKEISEAELLQCEFSTCQPAQADGNGEARPD